jgi:hypothetical protein
MPSYKSAWPPPLPCAWANEFRNHFPLGRAQWFSGHIAERFLSEGNGEAARTRGNRVRELNNIQSDAYRQVEEIRGLADAKATEIYSSAYN